MTGRYAAEMRRAWRRARSVPSATLHLPWGDIEYVDTGAGVPLLWSHGIFGGHDTAARVAGEWLGPGLRVVGPSRFGYFGSTLPPGATPADQADAYVALLDHLGLSEVVAVGCSAGGPSAIQLALRHADRLLGLVLASSYLPGMARPAPRPARAALRTGLRWQWGWWALKTSRPDLLARIMGVPKGWPRMDDPTLDETRDSLFPVSAKRDGAAFDTLVSEPACNGFPLEDIAVPTLLVHAADDALAPYRCVPGAAARIPGARLVTVGSGGHLYLGSLDQVRAATGAFIAAAAQADR